MSAVEQVKLSESEAERLSTRISHRLDTVADNWAGALDLIRDAITGGAYSALGYRSHGEYVKDRFGGSLAKLGFELRREVVRELSDAGLSTRAIAPIVDVSHMTVSNDLNTGVKTFTPDPSTPSLAEVISIDGIQVDTATGEVVEDQPVTETVTETHKTEAKTTVGIDGKQYKRPEPSAPRRRSLVDDAHTVSKELFLAIERIRTISTDDRYTRNKADILGALQPSADLALEILTDLFNTNER